MRKGSFEPLTGLQPCLLPFRPHSLNAYNFYAFPLGILEATGGVPKAWLYSNFIQLCWDSHHNAPVPFCHFLYDFSDVPALDRRQYSWQDARWFADPLDFVVHAVREGWYIFCTVDEFYLPGRSGAGTQHRLHDALIHGVSPDGALVAGYDVTRKLVSTWFTWFQIKSAIEEACTPEGESRPLLLFRRNHRRPYDFDTNHLRTELRDYIEGNNTSIRYRLEMNPWNRTYGLQTYSNLAQHLERVAQNNWPLDFRHFKILHEHHDLMLQRARWIITVYNHETQQPILHDLEVLAVQAEQLLLRVLWANARHSKQSMMEIRSDILTMQNKDRNVAESLHRSLGKLAGADVSTNHRDD